MPGLPERDALSALERLVALPGRLVILNVEERPAPPSARRRIRALEDRLLRIGSRGFTSAADPAILRPVNDPERKTKQSALGSG